MGDLSPKVIPLVKLELPSLSLFGYLIAHNGFFAIDNTNPLNDIIRHSRFTNQVNSCILYSELPLVVVVEADESN